MSNYELIHFRNFDNIGKDIEAFIDLDKDSYIAIDYIDDNKQIDNLVDGEFEHMERIVHIDHKYFYNDVEKSYRSKENIHEQFLLDFNRNKFYINNNFVDNINDITNYLEYKFSHPDKIIQIKMLSTQAIMGLPFQILQNSLFCKNKFYVSELTQNTDLYKGFKLDINIIDDNVLFSAIKYLRIFKLSKLHDDQTMYIIKVSLNFELNQKADVIMSIILNKVVK